MYYYAPIHFTVKELVDPDTFSVLGDSSLWLFKPEALWTLDAIRKFFNAPVLVNNWASGGNFKYRGFRPSNCKVGATNSQHRLGNAFDFNCSCDYSSTEIQLETDSIFQYYRIEIHRHDQALPLWLFEGTIKIQYTLHLKQMPITGFILIHF